MCVETDEPEPETAPVKAQARPSESPKKATSAAAPPRRTVTASAIGVVQASASQPGIFSLLPITLCPPDAVQSLKELDSVSAGELDLDLSSPELSASDVQVIS
jgi:hypothetical protein